jgi:formate--tetrahydrofolate ligase
MDIKCGYAGLQPHAMVIVATIRALRHHGGAGKDELNTANLALVQKGICNLEKHLENGRKFGMNPVVAINRFPADTEEEINFVIDHLAQLGARAVSLRRTPYSLPHNFGYQY